MRVRAFTLYSLRATKITRQRERERMGIIDQMKIMRLCYFLFLSLSPSLSSVFHKLLFDTFYIHSHTVWLPIAKKCLLFCCCRIPFFLLFSELIQRTTVTRTYSIESHDTTEPKTKFAAWIERRHRRRRWQQQQQHIQQWKRWNRVRCSRPVVV